VLLRDWTHAATEATGVLTLTVTPQREFGVRQDAGQLVGC
jgi:hypothetical protein